MLSGQYCFTSVLRIASSWSMIILCVRQIGRLARHGFVCIIFRSCEQSTHPEANLTEKRMTVIYVKRLDCDSSIPRYAHHGDSGLDLYSSEEITIEPGASALVRTGIAVALPAGTEGQIRPLSGLAHKWSVTVLNGPGTIDEGYRGEIGVLLINHGRRRYCVKRGARVAQLVVQRKVEVDVVEVESLGSTSRGDRGFGSTN